MAIIIILLFFSLVPASDTVSVLPASKVLAGERETNEDVVEIESSEWEGKNLSLADILAKHAGIQTRQKGGMGSFQSVSIRGMQGNQVAVAIDGVILQKVGVSDLGSIDLNKYERIEIYKGYIPAKFAANGMGGVINLISKDAAAKGGKLYVSYGSYNSRYLSMQVNSPITDSILWTSNVSYRASSNDFPYLNRNGTSYNTEDDFWTKRRNSEYSQTSGVHSFTFVGKRNSVLRIEHDSEMGGIPGREDQETQIANSANDAIMASLELEPRNKKIDFGLLGFAGAEKGISKWYYPIDKIGYLDEYAQSGLLIKNGGGQGSLHLGKTELYAYLNYQYLESQNKSAMLSDYELSNLIFQVSGTSIIQPVELFSITISGASRFSKKKQEAGKVSAVSYSEEFIAKSRYLNSGRISIGFDNIFVAVGHYFRDPSAFEMFGTSFGVLSNPDLKAEQGEQAEIGFRYKLKNTSASVTFFANQIRDRIFYYTSGMLSKPINDTEEAKVYGMEGEMQAELFKWLKLNMNATVQNPDKLPNEPREQYHSSMHFLFPYSFELSLEGEAHSMIYRDKAQRKEIPGKAFYHAMASYSPANNTKISFYVKNLTGGEYQHIYDAIPIPGRMFFVSYSHLF